MNASERAVTMGVFDGVHRGHQALLAETVRVADAHGYAPTALTFDPHPSALFAPARTPLLLSTMDERTALLRKHGVTDVIIAPFDRALAALTPDEFVKQWLVDRLRARFVIVGDDFRFGCDRSGDTAFLRRAGQTHGFETVTVAPVFVDGVPCRSTIIRQMLTGGQVESAQTLLGRPFTLTGTIAHGRKLGRTIGFPTANLQTAPGILVPGAGVYAGRATVAGATHLAAISIGTNPTVTPGADALRTVEAFLLDFGGDIYGETLTITFDRFLRGTEKYDSLDTLVAQMHRDVARVRNKA
ncbi:MAG: bifunctional riboflavin kinase/FAD synthetase [Armatimonadetes bacterium]|nr:bifunctional riboflavin kinase/FAD synthetase [Armatimonadota bacterium]